MNATNWIVLDASDVDPDEDFVRTVLMEFSTESEAMDYAKKEVSFAEDTYTETWEYEEGNLHELQSGDGYNVIVCKEDTNDELIHEFATRNF